MHGYLGKQFSGNEVYTRDPVRIAHDLHEPIHTHRSSSLCVVQVDLASNATLYAVQKNLSVTVLHSLR